MTEPHTIPPLIARLLEHPRAFEVTAENFEQTHKSAGSLMLFFTEDPLRYKETLDFAVVAGEVLNTFSESHTLRLGVLLPEAARALQPRYGFKQWPAFVLLREGLYLGAIEGMRTWEKFVAEITKLLGTEPSRPPTIGVSVQQGGDTCH
jgi:Hydrogenase-1 expression protein HyaE.